MSNRILVTVVALAALALGGSLAGCKKLEARDNLNKGVAAFKNAKYPDAVEFFGRAVELDPNFATARLYLASAYMNQYIPGAESADNVAMANNALTNFEKVLEADPKNATAVASIASLYYLESQGTSKLEDKLDRLEKARVWYQKLSEVDPSNKEAFYSLGVIAWARWYPDWNAARSKAGMKPDAAGPLKDKAAKEELKAKHGAELDDGIKSLQRALDLDKEYDDAMAYMNLLYRERADLADSSVGYEKDVATADEWIQKALDTRKIKAERQPKQTGIVNESSQK
jgi:tetratricopeptide (TPR) repeat protein